MTKTVKIRANGKINLGLNVTGREGDYHSLDTVMWEINFFDVVTVTTRKDDKVNLRVKGCGLETVAETDNNVYKAARLFMQTFNTNGCDVVLQKNIPVGSGLGGSSADIVATVKALAKVYNIKENLLPIVNELCSDGEFLLNGGCARIVGKGSVFCKLDPKTPLYLLLVVPKRKSVTANVFGEFDRGEYSGVGVDMDMIASAIQDQTNCFGNRRIFNALFSPAASLNEEIDRAYRELEGLNPNYISMSGSGSCVYGVYSSPELCLWAKSKMSDKFDLYVKETVI